MREGGSGRYAPPQQHPKSKGSKTNKWKNRNKKKTKQLPKQKSNKAKSRNIKTQKAERQQKQKSSKSKIRTKKYNLFIYI